MLTISFFMSKVSDSLHIYVEVYAIKRELGNIVIAAVQRVYIKINNQRNNEMAFWGANPRLFSSFRSF